MLTLELDKLGLRAGDTILDVGCGEGRHCHGLHYMGQGLNVVGLDADAASLHKAKAGAAGIYHKDGGDISFIKGDAYNLPFPDDSMDAVICSEVLEHLHDYIPALKEMRRVLKKGGVLAVSVPHNWTETICWRLAAGPDGYAFQPGGHIRIFDDFSLRREISALGFRFTRKHHAHALHTPYWWLKCAFWSRKESHPLIKVYHKLLVWEMMKRPWGLRMVERVARGWLGKSVVLYFKADVT